MEERRPVVKRQRAVTGNSISVVVDHAPIELHGFEDGENEPPARNYARSRARPSFRVESTDENCPSSVARASSVEARPSSFEDDVFPDVRKQAISRCGYENTRTGLMRPCLSVEITPAASMSHRRGSAAATPSNCQEGFESNLTRASLSTSHLPSLQHSSYSENGQKYEISFPGLSDPESMAASCESLPDVCLTTPSGAKKPLTSLYLSSIPAYLSPGKASPRGSWSFSGQSHSILAKPVAVQRSLDATSSDGRSPVLRPSRQSSSRASWAGEECRLQGAASLDFLASIGGSRTDQHIRHVKTEQLMCKHALKARLSKSQVLLDKAFALISVGSERTIIEGLSILAEVMTNCIDEPKIGLDLVCGLCDYLREAGYLDVLLDLFTNSDSSSVRIQTCMALAKCLHRPNRDYMTQEGFLERTVPVALKLTDADSVRTVVRLLENLFRHDARTCSRLIELSALDYLLNACKSTSDTDTCRYASIALANLAIYSDNECQQKMIDKKVPCWLFLLASSQDDVTRYNACLAICVLVSNKEIESAVCKSGTLALVEPFLLCLKPSEFAVKTFKHYGRPKDFLEKLVQMLNGKRPEPRSVAAFHFVMDASIKEQQEQLDVLREVGAVEALKQVAALPEEVAPKFAIQALEIIGESLPYKLSQQVPLWSAEDVQYWITKIGFEEYAAAFTSQKVDGDLLLLLTQDELERDIGMKSGLLRKRFMRELDSLKMAADYGCVDSTQLDRMLLSVDPNFSVYTYKLLDIGVDRTILPLLCEDVLRDEIENPVHRMKLCQWMEELNHGTDMEVSMLSKQMDIFISYRRSTGNQLASLLKVMLQLRGYKVFIDVDRLCAGQFDCSLLKNIQAAKHFILILTPGALDRCIGDDYCNDWVHNEILCAFEHNKNIIPVFDPQFEWPDEVKLPSDVRGLTRFNGVHWVHEYQEACVDKLEKFIKGELNTSMASQRSKAGSIISFRTTPKLGCNGLTGSNSNLYISYADTTELVLEVLANQQRSRGGHVCQACGHFDSDCVC